MTDFEAYAALELESDQLMDAACKATGLTDFGDTFFVEPMTQLLKSLREEANLNVGGKIGQVMRIVDNLSMRLQTIDHFKKYPEILDEEVEVAAVIAGLPRTGSTMLHRLLASDPALTGMVWWEGRRPAPLPGEERGDPSPRIAAGEEEVAAMIEASPDFMQIHPMDALAVDEEVLTLEQAFYSGVPASAVKVPSYDDWLYSHDQTPAYLWLKDTLKFLQWQDPSRKGKAWVLKTPHHLSAMDVVMKTFPGALIIQTHRDPLQTIPSYCSMVASFSRPSTDALDMEWIGKHWSDRWAANMKFTMKVRTEADPELFIDIPYLDALKKPMEQAEKIYAQMGRDLTDEARASMQSWLAENEKDKHGKHDYSVDDYDLSNERILELFGEYRDRFIVDG